MAKSLSPPAKTKNGLTVLLGSLLLQNLWAKSLTVHSWVPPSSKFMGKILIFFGKITANHADSAHFAHSPRKLCKIHYKIHTH